MSGERSKMEADLEIGAAGARLLLEVAGRSARAASAVLHPAEDRGAGLRCKDSPADLVTAADLAAEQAAVAVLRAERSRCAIVGEEGTLTAGTTGVTWLVDAIDGTANYVAGLAEWSVSIAALIDGEPVAGIVHAPALQRTYTAALGVGARCDDRALVATGTRNPGLAEAIVATGFSAHPERRARQVAELAEVAPHVRDLRCRGAASLELSAVAAGQIDVYFERGLNLWDVAAGVLMVTEAGREVSGGPPYDELLLAGATRALAELRAVISGAPL